MFKKSFFFVLFLPIFTILLDCGRSNPISNDFPPPDPVNEKVVKDRTGGDPYGDTIKTWIVIDTTADTTGATDSCNVGFLIDLKGGQFGTDGGLSKIALLNSVQRAQLRDRRINSVDAITIEFVSLNSTDTIRRNYPIVNGKCAVKSARVPSGHSYQVLVGLWCIEEFPWTTPTFNIFDRAFSSLDTVDLETKSKDTLNLVFYEMKTIKHLFGLRNPPGVWTEGKTYNVSPFYHYSSSTPAVFKSNILYGYYVTDDLSHDDAGILIVTCDTGRIYISFWENLMTMLDNNGIVMVAADSVFLGIKYTAHDLTEVVPFDPPQHIRASKKIRVGD